MSFKNGTKPSTAPCWAQIKQLAQRLNEAGAVLVGAGAGLSAAAGMTYEGARFQRYFSDFHRRYGITDMYSGGFYPFDSLEEYWAWWSRQILINRYEAPLGQPYLDLLTLVQGREYFVLTTNVDHQFQLAGFDKARLFYTQGDYGLWQCARACHRRTYDNEAQVRQMVREQRDLRVPAALVPHCPQCGAPMTMNLRADGLFVEDEGWHEAQARYEDFLRRHQGGRILYLELGVGLNTPGIIKLPFWRQTHRNPEATYACINLNALPLPREIAPRSIQIEADVGQALSALVEADAGRAS